ncbi:MAG TPA: ribonuclease R [Pirellulaceae bacterium]|nr:ribonuclease R [Pirellulaceae bacterium]
MVEAVRSVAESSDPSQRVADRRVADRPAADKQSVDKRATRKQSARKRESDDVIVDSNSDNAEDQTDEDEPRRHQSKYSGERFVVSGVFRRAAGGYGFVRPQGATLGDRSGDIYVPLESAQDAASGDLVTVRISKRRRHGQQKLSGEIVEILKRDTHQFVGVYSERGGEAFVQVDGRMFTQPIPVGDPGAKGARDGDKVVIEMVRFPSHYSDGEGVIIEVLGARGKAGVDTLAIMREFELPEQFPEEVLEAARRQAEQFDETKLDGRVDLTHETIITIDPLDARDFDDAVSLEKLENGHWLLGVHIADVAHFVPAKSTLDREARERGTSVYLPDRVIPMLPEVISNNLASLQPHKVRYARTVTIEFTDEGVRVATDVKRSAIKSRRRFTYEEVDEYLADPDAWREKLVPEVHSLLGRMHELAMVLRRRRLELGAIELTLPEIKLVLDRRGQVEGARIVENTVSHQIIEEFMLAANEAVAWQVRQKELPLLSRVHGAPDPRKLRALTEFVRSLGIPCESLESRFEIKRVIAEVAGRPEQHAVNYAVLRSMQKAHYAPTDEGHYALHSRDYCHFTSPIRRYPDLVVHRIFDHLARGHRPPETIEHLFGLGEHCSEREQRAETAERELIKVKLLSYLAQRIGEKLEAVITGVEAFGIFAQGVTLPAEGLIHVTGLRDDYYHYDSASHSLVGRRAGNAFRLGDVITVQIARVDIDGRELDFRLVDHGTSRPGGRGAGGQSPKNGGKFGGRSRGTPDRTGRNPKPPRGNSSKAKKGRRKGRW